jgi:hypothetical protein
MTVSQAARLMRGRPERALPLFAGTRLVDIVTISDLLDVPGRRFRKAATQTRRVGRAA